MAYDFFVLMGAYLIITIGRAIYNRKKPKKVKAIITNVKWEDAEYFGKRVDEWIDRSPWISLITFTTILMVETYFLVALTI